MYLGVIKYVFRIVCLEDMRSHPILEMCRSGKS